MSILTRTILTSAMLILPLFSTGYTVSFDKQEPIAQVYEVKGGAMIKSSLDGSISVVKKGCLLALDDLLTLDKNASIAMYFKNGGRKEVQAKDSQSAYKVADLLPKTEAYNQNVPLFGATRGIDTSPATSHPGSFFYPHEAVILDNPPLIEFTLFHGSGGGIALGGALVQIVKNGVVLDSKRFDSLEYGSLYDYGSAKLDGQTEYRVELRFELQKTPGNIAISFPLYIVGTSDTESASKFASFSDPIYRSFESTFIDHKGEKRAIAAFKQLVRRSVSPQPVILIELFIP